jgi:hypothetical protein
MGGFAKIPAIPQIQPDVQAPMEPRRTRLADIPETKGLGDLIPSALGAVRAGADLGQVIQVQNAHKAILDSAQAEENIKNQFNQVRVDSQQLPGDQQAQYVQQHTQDISDKFLSDPANSHISAYMGTRIPALQGLFVRDAQEGGAHATALEHDATNKSLNTQGATDAASDFKINPDGSIVDGPRAQAVRGQVQNRVNAQWGKNPAMANAYMQDFEAKVAPERAQFIAQNQPELIGKYLAGQPGKFTPEQINNFNTIARDALEKPYLDALAAHKAKSQAVSDDLDKMQSTGTPGLQPAAFAAKRAGFVSAERYEELTNIKWQDPKAQSAPGLVDGYKAMIDKDPYSVSEATVGGISSDDISPNDRRGLQAYRANALADAKTGLGAQFLRSMQSIREAMRPGMATTNLEAKKLQTDGMLSDLRAAKEDGEIKTPQALADYANKLIKANLPAGAAPKKPVTIHIGVPIAPGTAAKIAAEARARGWEAGTPGAD